MSKTSIPGGGKWPASKIGKDGKFARADLHMGVASGKTSCAGNGIREREREREMSRTATSIPGGGTGANSAFMFRTSSGYAAGAAAQAEGSGTSIFDPVLCELAYRWFCPPGGSILDPFAGGSVRGIVASKLGRKYTGIELRPEQVEANREQAATITPDNLPIWITGDSRNAGSIAPGEYDFVFSCPPYGNLEEYSEDPADLSAMSNEDFDKQYRVCVRAACDMLKPDRFACFVVGDYRDKAGLYRNLPGETIRAFQEAGLHLYNEAILITAVGSLPIRVRKQFESGRKLGKTHQNVLVFVKGSAKKATEAIGKVEAAEWESAALT